MQEKQFRTEILKGVPASQIRTAVFGSGQGTTARALLEYTKKCAAAYCVVLFITNRPESGLCKLGEENNLPCFHFAGSESPERVLDVLRSNAVQLVILAGYTKLVPADIIVGMNGKIINTHPALLPHFGGKGMYGRRVHEAVAASGVRETGVTLHWVTAEYDKGDIIEQVRITIPDRSTALEIEQATREAEKEWLPGAVHRVAEFMLKTEYYVP